MKKLSLKKIVKEWLIPFAVEALVIYILFTQILAINNVPTSSMAPTVRVGQIVLSNRLFSAENLKRGDVVTFECEEMDKLLIKRLIGLPGDKIEIYENEVIYINGELLEEDYVSSFSDFEGEFEVPAGHYFFMGDNRANSGDCRFLDNPYISENALVAKTFFGFWPLDNIRFY